MSTRKRNNKEFTNNNFSAFTAKNPKQKLYFNLIATKTIVFATGCAGTGKSHVAIAAAAEQLYNKNISQIIVTRPAVGTSNEKMGFLPGDIDEKFEEYVVPIREILDQMLGRSHVDAYLRNGAIKPVPLGFCRGRTFNDAFVLLDEAQNTDPEQMKMLLTRTGQGSKVLVNGDLNQRDTIKGVSGLEDAIRRLSWHQDIGFVEFERNECVRHGLVSDILSAYEDNQ